MTPVGFPQQNKVYGEGQPEYLPLPACDDGVVTVSCWKLSLWERLIVLLYGRLWLQQMNFGKPLQPQLPTVEGPFSVLESLSKGS
jgi:hypothetical protein